VARIVCNTYNCQSHVLGPAANYENCVKFASIAAHYGREVTPDPTGLQRVFTRDANGGFVGDSGMSGSRERMA
jgi:hypothetical protein